MNFKQHCVFTLQVIDILIGTDEHARRIPKYLIHFNGWNRRYHYLTIINRLLSCIILIVFIIAKSHVHQLL